MLARRQPSPAGPPAERAEASRSWVLLKACRALSWMCGNRCMSRWRRGLRGDHVDVLGSKEVLCEEYIPALLEHGVRCVLIIRDPRGVIASANNGRYRELVGDRYPLMMLIRLWRKTAAYWLKYCRHPLVKAIRYKDLAADPRHVLEELTAWLGIDRFPEDSNRTPLKDHFGRPWSGNSSFGDRATVDSSSNDSWRRLLAHREQRFISACAWRELNAIGYPVASDIGSDDVRDFFEDTRGVRVAYLAQHDISDERVATKSSVWHWPWGHLSGIRQMWRGTTSFQRLTHNKTNGRSGVDVVCSDNRSAARHACWPHHGECPHATG